MLLENGAALRGTFIIDPDGVLRHITVNELDVGRSVDETLRVLQALQMGKLCPVGWKPGEATLSTVDRWLAKAFPKLPDAVLEVIATLGPGEFFGEVGLLNESRRTASARAKGALEVLALDWDGFRALVEASELTKQDFALIFRERMVGADR